MTQNPETDSSMSPPRPTDGATDARDRNDTGHDPDAGIVTGDQSSDLRWWPAAVLLILMVLLRFSATPFESPPLWLMMA